MSAAADILIRNVSESDLGEIAELYTLFWNDNMNLSKMKETFRNISQNPEYILLCAEHKGKIVGTIQGVVCSELYGECRPFLVMENFVVAPGARKQGIGRRLLDQLEKTGKEKNCSQIIFITESDRTDTIRFYEKVGFDAAAHKGFKKPLT